MELLEENSCLATVRILDYCLRLNLIHMVAVLRELGSLAICLRRTHGRHAQYRIARHLHWGHRWQNRFHSRPMNNDRLWTALK